MRSTALFDDGQADAGAVVFFFTMDPAEDSEDSLVMFGSDADAVVLNEEFNNGFRR